MPHRTQKASRTQKNVHRKKDNYLALHKQQRPTEWKLFRKVNWVEKLAFRAGSTIRVNVKVRAHNGTSISEAKRDFCWLARVTNRHARQNGNKLRKQTCIWARNSGPLVNKFNFPLRGDGKFVYTRRHRSISFAYKNETRDWGKELRPTTTGRQISRSTNKPNHCPLGAGEIFLRIIRIPSRNGAIDGFPGYGKGRKLGCFPFFSPGRRGGKYGNQKRFVILHRIMWGLSELSPFRCAHGHACRVCVCVSLLCGQSGRSLSHQHQPVWCPRGALLNIEGKY